MTNTSKQSGQVWVWVAVVIAAAALVYYFFVRSDSVNPNPSASPTASVSVSGSPTATPSASSSVSPSASATRTPTPAPTGPATYRSTQYGIQFQYDSRFLLNNYQNLGTYFSSNGVQVANIAIPPELYPKTNFGLATANIAVRANSDGTQCLTYVTGADQTAVMNRTETHGGNVFSTATLTEGAAGTAYQTRIYRLWHNQTCYEISLNFGVANIGNYPAGSVSEVNQADVWNRLTQIVDTFKFL
ncbi:MAG TPA: hypothetical protein VG866_02180 [Candidatus Paceibacterota bacterium]|nr:hypothetical protein [Candidatus Paceibacterota bacterium]